MIIKGLRVMANFKCEHCGTIVREEDILSKTYVDMVEYWGADVPCVTTEYICPVCSEADCFDLTSPVAEENT